MTANPNLFGNHYYREVSRARCLQQKLVNNKDQKLLRRSQQCPREYHVLKWHSRDVQIIKGICWFFKVQLQMGSHANMSMILEDISLSR